LDIGGLDSIFAFVSTSISTKKSALLSEGRHFKGAPQPFWQAVAPNCPLDPPLWRVVT